MGNVSAAVVEGVRREAGATVAIAATEHPPPVSILSLPVDFTSISTDYPGVARPHTLAAVRRPRLL